MVPAASDELGRRLKRFTVWLGLLLVGTYTFLSYWEYSREYYAVPGAWDEMLAGHATAPGQYRIGVMFLAAFLSRLTHGHLAVRHMLAVLDCFFLATGTGVVFYLISISRRYLALDGIRRATTILLGFALLLYYLSWLWWYHRPETLANFACLAVSMALVAGRPRIPASLAAAALVGVAAYLATVRADSGAALAVGIIVIALMPAGRRLALGRGLQASAGAASLAVVVGIQYWLKHYKYPHNPYQSDVFQLLNNLKSPIDYFCVLVALGPWLVTMRLAWKHWQRLEAWECALVVASVVEFLMYLVVAMVDEVRLFLPYPLALLPTTALLLGYELVGGGDSPAASELEV